MDFLHRFPCVQGGGRAGIYPAVSGAKLLDQSLVHHRATERRRQTTTRTHNYGQFRAAISLMCMSLLDCGRKPWGTNTRTRCINTLAAFKLENMGVFQAFVMTAIQSMFMTFLLTVFIYTVH